MSLKAYKFRFYPNKTQQEQLKHYFGAKRFVWNTCLAWRSNFYKEFQESVSYVDFSRELTWLKKLDIYQWLKQVPLTILTQGLMDQEKAFKHFFKEGAGYPQFKSRHGHQSIRFQLDQRHIEKNYKAGELLKVTGLGELKVRWTREPVGKPKMVSISMDTAGRYFVSMAIEEQIKKKPVVGKTVGIDLGTLETMALSDGFKVPNPHHLNRHKAQMKKLQQRLTRQQKGSNRREKTKLRIGKLHTRIADCRREYLHQTTSKIINENQVIVIEDLNVKGITASSKGNKENPGKMVRQKSGLNRSILDVSFGEIVRQLEYKAEWYGRTLIKVDRFFPSSKLCSCCGHKADEMNLSIREWTCPKCKIVHDRDINAALNIETEGLRSIAPEGMQGLQLRDSGGEGVYSMAVSPRSIDQPSDCLEQS